MTRRLLLTYLTITAFVLLVTEVPLALTYQSREENRFIAALERDARVVASGVEDALERGVGRPPVEVAVDYATRIGGRVVVVDATGTAVADSDDPTGPGRDFSSRPEIATALDGGVASGVRRSETLGTDLIYAAVPVVSSGTVHGAVRITYPASELDARTRRNLLRLVALAGVVLVAVASVGLLLAHSVTEPVAELQTAASRLAAGDLTTRVQLRRGPPEVQELGRRFDDMAARIDSLVRAQQGFVADASHQLRTPLTALRLRLENLAAASSDAATTAELEASLDEVARLSRLVDGLLTLARADAATPELEAVDASAVARDRVQVWEPLAEERSVRLGVEAPDTATVRAVAGGLEQILDNLLANALDAVPEGGHVLVTVTGGADAVAVRVDDDGPGLDEEAMARALDRFWRQPGARPGGSGLGLAIVAQLARASRGDVTLTRSPLGGLRVEVRLPPAGSAAA